MKIIAFAGSNSRHSINKKLATYAASLFNNAEVEVLDLNDYQMPLYSVDIEKEIPTPDQVQQYLSKIFSADFIVLSLAENNSSFNVGFKNIFDWVSRTEQKQFQNKPMLLMATSPGKRGGMTVLEHARTTFPHYGAVIKAVFSLPAFYENFDEEKGITNTELNDKLLMLIKDIS